MINKYNIAVLPGDGIGPEVIHETKKVLDAAAQTYVFQLQYHEALIGAIAIDETNDPLPQDTLAKCKASDAVLFGAIGDPKYDNDPSAKIRPEQGLLALRKALGLYANVRPVKAYQKLIDKSPLKESIIQGTDMVIYRELISGIYFGDKSTSADGKSAVDICSYHQEEIECIARLAFKAARQRNNKVTLIDKANVLETSRLWRKVVKTIAMEFPEVELDFMFVDNAAMQLILNPKQFDVILTENMFGDIISDEASVIGGSIGLLPSASVGNESALFEPIHGSYPQAKGLGIANPIASILSGAMMLEHLGEHDAAEAIQDAVLHCINAGVLTSDLDKTSKFITSDIGDYICNHIKYRTGYRYKDTIPYNKSTII
ncbi:3-isopropylmalate dehydrogenase [Myroides marinus]|uniref:3-isopropylmalate dehydrogenase n=1 Tax=Myroides marinus TaxID=703342 RepID=UPI0007422F1C|nr:3-isopropylmalate dehydrogenase [Myroides marinus]KUF40255.1 3-isopropylmalate dehydrogenase [Myroides marinus]MDM1345955.1 3-isopropylmalate dehydrogenase [Myroides marinus]MDM1353138.1 3-isopropylmalate dehydrogenase [Myroides marinus]MDM1360708.1 3-isopropylmalate dehydrogenase [Myroides marinus]MDM1368646.1 3-isopropylmalate dehydrogenase [Myroides marinus]